MKKNYTWIMSISLAASALCLTAEAETQTAKEEVPKSDAVSQSKLSQEESLDQDQKLDTVVVTARRREESLKDVPESISVFGSALIEAAEIDEMSDFAQLTPGVNVQQGFQGGDRPIIVFRGVGQFGGTAPSVVILSDGIYQPLGEPLRTQLFDIERIEVVKGPQGALYGRDTIGGVINVITKPPGDQFEGRALATHSPEASETSVAGAVNIPLVKEKLSVRLSGSYLTSDGYFVNGAGTNQDFREEWFVRGRLYSKIGESTTIDARIGFNSYNNGYNSAFFAPTADTYYDDIGFLDGVDYSDGFNDRESLDAAIRLDTDLGFAELTSITQFIEADQNLVQDADFGLAPGLQLVRDGVTEEKRISQEVRLTSRSDQEFRWILGAFAETGELNSNLFDTEINIPLGVIARLGTEASSDRYAVFAQADWDLSDRIVLSGALRYDNDKRSQTKLFSNDPEQTKKYNKISPKASVSYKLSDDWTTYATYAEGFRSGGFDATTALPFNTENLTSYEVGLKGNLFSDRAFMTAAVYRIDYDDQQVSVLARDPVSGALVVTTENLGKSQNLGFELALNAKVTENFSINMAYDNLNTEIKQDPDPTVVGNNSLLSTDYTFSLSGEHRHSLSHSFELVSRLEYYRQGEQVWNKSNSLSQDPYSIVSARIALEADDWTLAISGENLFDQQYNDQIFPDFAIPGLNVAYPGLPARWTISASKRF